MLSYYKEYSDKSILPQLVAKLPWGHNILLIEKIKDLHIRIWYIQQCIESQWTRKILESQLKNQLYERQGKAVTFTRKFKK